MSAAREKAIAWLRSSGYTRLEDNSIEDFKGETVDALDILESYIKDAEGYEP